MPQLPTSPAPSSVSLDIHQPSGKSTSLSGHPQSRSSGLHSWEVDFSYALLEFDERDAIMAFLTSLKGRVVPFDVIVPTHSENSGIVSSSTALSDGIYAVDATTITLRSVDGTLKPFNLLSVNGKTKVYSVVTASAVVGGVQTVTIMPPLKTAMADGAIWNVKDVPIYCALDDDSISCSTKGMSATVKFNMVEEIT